MSTDAYIGEQVHRRMWRLRLRQTELAPHLGMTQSALSRKLRGERAWSFDDVQTIAGLLGVDRDDLLPPRPAGPDSGRPTAEYADHLALIAA